VLELIRKIPVRITVYTSADEASGAEIQILKWPFHFQHFQRTVSSRPGDTACLGHLTNRVALGKEGLRETKSSYKLSDSLRNWVMCSVLRKLKCFFAFVFYLGQLNTSKWFLCP